MTVEDMPYLEIYVDDGPAAVDYFTSVFGFATEAVAGPETGLADRRATALRTADVHLVITTPVDGAGPVADHLAVHGDGVADVAFTAADVRAAHGRAVEAGLRSLTEPGGDGRDRPRPAVAGFGGLVHSLVPAGVTLPAYPWRPAPSSGSPSPDVRGIDHLAVCLEAGTLHDTVDTYGRAFGLEYYSSEYISVGEQAMDSIVVRDPSGRITFTMIEPDTDRKPGQIDRFLDRNAGSGVQHVAFLVDDIVSTVEGARERGGEFLNTPDTYYDALSERLPGLAGHIDGLRATRVLADQDEWGYLLQIFTRSPHPRDSLFYELIQRNDARGFGSANIRALYEAVERAKEF